MAGLIFWSVMCVISGLLISLSSYESGYTDGYDDAYCEYVKRGKE